MILDRQVARSHRKSTLAAVEVMRAGSVVVGEHDVHTAEWEQFENDRHITDREPMRGY